MLRTEAGLAKSIVLSNACHCLLAACKAQPMKNFGAGYKLGQVGSQGVTIVGQMMFTRLMQRCFSKEFWRCPS